MAKSQVVSEEDGGSTKFAKKVTELETKFAPIMIIFAVNISTCSSYAFSLVLFFIVIIPLIMFNLMGLHLKLGHRVFIGFFDNLWLFGTFFWLINIWTITKYCEPYHIFMVTQ